MTGFAVSLVLSLQLMLAGVIATQMAVAAGNSPFEICYGADSSTGGSHDNGSSPIHANHAPCVICSFASVSAPAPTVGTFVIFRTGFVAAYVAATSPAAIAGERHNPRLSQGPPQIA
jgi:hypothetical protein